MFVSEPRPATLIGDDDDDILKYICSQISIYKDTLKRVHKYTYTKKTDVDGLTETLLNKADNVNTIRDNTKYVNCLTKCSEENGCVYQHCRSPYVHKIVWRLPLLRRVYSDHCLTVF